MCIIAFCVVIKHKSDHRYRVEGVRILIGDKMCLLAWDKSNNKLLQGVSSLRSLTPNPCLNSTPIPSMAHANGQMSG